MYLSTIDSEQCQAQSYKAQNQCQCKSKSSQGSTGQDRAMRIREGREKPEFQLALLALARLPSPQPTQLFFHFFIDHVTYSSITACKQQTSRDSKETATRSALFKNHNWKDDEEEDTIIITFDCGHHVPFSSHGFLPCSTNLSCSYNHII